MTGRRFYPMVEVLEDGTLIVIGGDTLGGYVNTATQDNPTYEFFPPRGAGQAVPLQFLADTLPLNLYALTWLMPSGLLFMQANLSTILLNYTSQVTFKLPDMPYAPRVYPASAASAMLPLTPDNNYEVTLLFCGGSNPPQWGSDQGPGFNITTVAADNTCVRISVSMLEQWQCAQHRMRTVRRRIYAAHLTVCRGIIEQLEQVEIDAFPTAFVTD
jgi:hypothetical protein